MASYIIVLYETEGGEVCYTGLKEVDVASDEEAMDAGREMTNSKPWDYRISIEGRLVHDSGKPDAKTMAAL